MPTRLGRGGVSCQRALVVLVAASWSATAYAQHTCSLTRSDWCVDVTAWCHSRNCAAYKLDVDGSKHDWIKAPESVKCKLVRNAKPTKVGKPGDAVYCVSEDTTTAGFECFSGDDWRTKLLGFLQVRDDDSGRDGALNATSCETMSVDSPDSGMLFLSGKCCTGRAVPCKSGGCLSGFEPLGPGFTSSFVGIMLGICAIVHTMSSIMCIVFASRLVESSPSLAMLSHDDKSAVKNIITMLGAGHGGFAGVLVFGALQDWLYGKSQIAIAALAWYGLLGPVADAMQHRHVEQENRSMHFLSMCVSCTMGECLGKPPKMNYLILCIGLLIAIGAETLGIHFVIAATMVLVGFVISFFIAQSGVRQSAELEESGPEKRSGVSDMR